MRTVIAVIVTAALAIGLMAWAGWLTFSQSADRATIDINKQEIKEDTENLLRKGQEATREAEQKGRAVKRATGVTLYSSLVTPRGHLKGILSSPHPGTIPKR
jgi:hypothetical protein